MNKNETPTAHAEDNREHRMTTKPVITLKSEDVALDVMRQLNRFALDHAEDTYVIVDGPENGDYTVMDLRDATDAGFLYRWEVA